MNRQFYVTLSMSVATALLAACGGSPPVATPSSGAFAGAASLVHRSSSATYQVLYRFAGGEDGSQPHARLINVKGVLYGTTAEGGGTGCKNAVGCGTIFTIDGSGAEKVFYSFHGRPYDGSFPYSRLLDVDGTLYGTTYQGGSSEDCGGNCGTVYSITTAGKEAVLHDFGGGTGDGAFPTEGLTDVNGTLYGTTDRGGARDGNGTVYRISKAGSEKLLHRFVLGGGGYPRAGLTAVKGTLYGTTMFGCDGKDCSGSCDCGTVFSISTTGVEKVIHVFKGGLGGANPQAPVILVNGTLYGTTYGGGASHCETGCGVIYSLSTSGKFKVLYRFHGGSDGGKPQAGLIDVNGTLYGTTDEGGGSAACFAGCGTVYSVSTSGAETVLHGFAGGSDGTNPEAPLLDVNGTLYGTTVYGGGIAGCGNKTDGCGTVFALTP